MHLLLLLASLALAEERVILVTVDGVRWQEFLGNKPDVALTTDTAPTFPLFWKNAAPKGVVLEEATINNFASLSLPGYQSIMAGRMTGCFSNNCGRTKHETLPENLQKNGLSVEVVTAWTGVELAVQRATGTLAVHIAATDADAWAAARLALARKPRFLYIAFDEADDAAHAGDMKEYLAALRRYDAWLADLSSSLDAETTLIVTTDHGRGTGADWTSHGGRAEAARIWLFAQGPRTKPGVVKSGGAHVQIRPTIETILGVKNGASTLPGVLP